MIVQNSFLVFIFVFPSLFHIHSGQVSFDRENFISNSSGQCQVSNELYWKMIQWYYGQLKHVDVHVLIESSLTVSMNQLTSVFIKEISDSKNRCTLEIYFNLNYFHALLIIMILFMIFIYIS